jgi:FlaA1/EpsC-like NDP-sugar epimerase
VADAIGPNCKKEIVGVRPGEKIHEEMITASDSYNSYDIGKYYVILPTDPSFSLSKYIKEHNAKKLEEGFSYTSDKNDYWIKTEEIRKLIKENLNIQID